MTTTRAESFHSSLTAALEQARMTPSSRAASVDSPAAIGYQTAMAQDFQGPVDVLNYALTLEHLETAFYRIFNNQFSPDDFTAAGFGANVPGRFITLGAHEAAHVDVIADVIVSLGGEPVSELMYSFGVDDVVDYVAVARVLENLGVGAYTGAAQFLIDNGELLTAALTIHAIEARHASYLNLINGELPYPDAFEPALTPEEVLAAAAPLIVSEMPSTGTGAALNGGTGRGLGLAAAGAATLGAAALAMRRREGTSPESSGIA